MKKYYSTVGLILLIVIVCAVGPLRIIEGHGGGGRGGRGGGRQAVAAA